MAAPAGDGMIAGIIDRVFENPAMSGGLMVMALTATAIVSNAMFLQNGHHPDPLFMTRPSVAREVKRPVAVRPAPRVEQPAALVAPPLPRLSPVHARPAPEPVVVSPPILAIQRELARLGLYSGAIDGVTGARTAAAIAAYEKAAGLPVTGEPTAELLEAMKQPLPPKPQAINTLPDTLAAELDRRESERAAKIAAQEQAQAEAAMKKNMLGVQGALNRIGYGPVPVDGANSDETIDAIRRFELDYGLPVSGELNQSVIGRLVAIGAMKAT